MGKTVMKKTLVISGINLYNGGPLSVYKDLLDALIENDYHIRYHIIAFVHKTELFKEYKDKIELLELPRSRKSYLFRLYYEYVYFKSFSKKRKIDVWFSVHDMTPNVKAKKRYVYCHNPSPFLKRSKNIWKLSKTNYLMSVFYKYFYKINIKKNTAVIVQQDWLRKEFKKMFGIENIIVARPNVEVNVLENTNECIHDGNKKVFIYSAYPRPFKNFEVICKACRALKEYKDKFEVWLTIDGSENAYSSMIRKEFADVSNIKWLGLVKRDEMMKKYAESDYLIFPSVLETWGLPITEYEAFKKPMLVADLPYAHETVGNYDKVAFFDPYAEKELAEAIKGILKGDVQFDEHSVAHLEQPFTKDWQEVLKSCS